eukprot:m.2038 g.2038  ORF g.2038 m.2038 type:complete len:64 (+) comp1443_c0_seq1:101-292(+)
MSMCVGWAYARVQLLLLKMLSPRELSCQCAPQCTLTCPLLCHPRLCATSICIGVWAMAEPCST